MKTIRECYNVQYLMNMQYVWCMMYYWCALSTLDARALLWYNCNLCMGIWQYQCTIRQSIHIYVNCVKENHFVSFIMHFHLFEVQKTNCRKSCTMCHPFLSFGTFGIRHSDTNNNTMNRFIWLSFNLCFMCFNAFNIKYYVSSLHPSTIHKFIHSFIHL